MLNLLDFILIIFFVWKGWRGMKSGFIIEFGGFIILYISFIFSTSNNFITDLSNKTMNALNISTDLNWLFSFVFIYILLFFLLRLAHNAIESLSLGFINNFLGLIFGFLKWWLILNILIFVLLIINDKIKTKNEMSFFNQEIVKNSEIIKIMYYTATKYRTSF